MKFSRRFQLLPDAKVQILASEGDCPQARLDYPGTSMGVDLYWNAAGHLAGRLAIFEETGWISEIYGSKEEAPVVNAQLSVHGTAGIMTVCVPAGYEDTETLVLNEMTLDPDARLAALSGEYGGSAFRITIRRR